MKNHLSLVLLLLPLLVMEPAYGQVNLGTSSSATNPERSGDATTGLFSSTTDAVSISSGGTEMMRVNGTGVGIGTTSPLAILDVRGVVGATGAMFGYGTTGVSLTENWPAVLFNSYYSGSGELFMGSGYAGNLYFDPTGGNFYFQTSTSSGSAGGTVTANSAALYIKNNGNVGIGTTAPGTSLQVDPSSTGTIVEFGPLYNGGTPYNTGNKTVNLNTWSGVPSFIICVNNVNCYTQAVSTSGYYSLTDGSSNTILYAQNGNVGIGNTSPSYLLHVGSSSASGIVMKLQNSSGACTHNPGASSETVSCSSDERLKTDIEDTTAGLAWLGDMRIRDFTVKATGERKTGVIAQELMETHPGMVHENDDGLLSVQQPNPWVLVKAVQDLHSLISAQQAEIDELKQAIARR